MTMADGEGKPLDEIESGDDDPQGWYFDLPGGAWERQEEKNRTLRQRVLGNLTEEEAARKREPFATRPPEPEPEKKGGLFGFGRKKKEAEKPRESAGGTWVLNRGQDSADEGDDDEPDGWSTEPPLNLPPAQSEPILLRRRTEDDRTADPWGTADGGFSLGGERADDDDGLAGMRAWAHGSTSDDAIDADDLPEPVEAPAAFVEPIQEFESDSEVEEPSFAEAATYVEALEEPEFEEAVAEYTPAPTYVEALEDAPVAESDDDFLAGVRAWAESKDESEAPAYAEVLEETEDEAEPDPAPALLRLRPRSHDDDGKRLDWSFGPKGWDEEPEAPSAAEEDSLEAMRAWAERNKEADHPHFTVEHKADPEEESAELPPPLPLRPLHREEPEVRRPLNLNPNPAPPMDGPRDLPLIRRSHTENEPQQQDSSSGSTRWDEFFNLKPAEDEEVGDGEQSSSLADGLSAMRDWAKSRPEEKPQEIPEEFLKPFDWETEEDGEPVTNEIPDELLKPFDWEVDEEADADEPEDAPAAELAPVEPVVFEAPDAIAPGAHRTDDEDDDLDIFGQAAAPIEAPKPEKKPGFVGRLFGRKKKQEPEPVVDDLDDEPGDWIMPSEESSSDVRIAEPAATTNDDEVDEHDGWTAAASTVFASDPHTRTGTAGWGGSRSAGWTEDDQETITSFADELTSLDEESNETEEDPDEEPSFAPAALVEDEPESASEWTVADDEDDDVDAIPAPAASLFDTETDDELAAELLEVNDEEDSFAPAASVFDTETDDELVAELLEVEDEEDSFTPAASFFDAETDDEFVAELLEVEDEVEESSLAPTALFESESAEADDEDGWAPEPVAPAAFAWTPSVPATETPAVEDEPVETVAEQPVEAIAEVTEPVAADEKPWWERPAVEDEDLEAVAEQPAEVISEVSEAVAETPWWERPAVEDEPVEAVTEQPAEVIAEVTEPVAADEKPWWERSAVEDEPVETVAEQPVEAIPEVTEPVAETPWWERSAVEDEPVEAVAEQPAEAVSDVTEPVTAFEAPAVEKKWWEEAAVDDEPGDVADLATQSAAFVPPVEDESPWAAEEATPAAAVNDDDDDPWAEFVTPGHASVEPTETRPAPVAWAAPEPTVQPEAPEEDMWGDIAAHAEEAMKAPAHDDRLDLAASLESQMAEEPAPAYSWETPTREWSSEATDFAPAEEEDDVILRAFEAHAATPDKPEAPDPELVRQTEEALAALFGSDAEDIVAESSEEGNEKSFIRMSAWAPQRSIPMDGGWAADEEVEAELSGASYASIAGGDAGFAPPPWAVDEFEGGGSPSTVRDHGKAKTWIRELVETGLLALLVFLSVRASFQNFKVDGSSMFPTLEDGQFLIVNKLVYSEVDMEKLGDFVPFIDAGDDPKRHVFHGPERGDIIVLRDPRNPETDLIKRVIGLPGETIEIVDGKVYINDLLLEEPYITTPWSDNKAKILIPAGEYFVMGDNRDNSLDSRSSQVGLVQEDLIIGKAMLSYWPRDKFGLAPNDGGELTDQKPVLTTQRLED